MFISFEGIDKCGKSTQVDLFTKYLETNAIDYIKVREPGGTELGERIRHILLHQEHQEMCARSELLLFLASRAQLVESVIKKALSEGKVVVADRFAHSSVAYQGCGRGLGVETVEMLNNFATGMIYPEIVFLIDIPVEFVLDRLKNSGESGKDRIEKEEIEFWGKVRRCYLKMAKEHEEFILIDGTKSIEEMQEKIIEEFEKRYGDDNSGH